MAFSLTAFANNTTNQLAALDANTATLSAAAPIPCSSSGTNTVVLTQNTGALIPSIPITAYSQNMLFTAVCVGTNTGSVTAAVGALSALNVYKDSSAGPALLTGGEIIINNAFSLLYDAALNSGAGGFHLTSSTQAASTPISPSSVQIAGNSTLTNLLSGNSPTLTFTATPGWSSQDQTFSVTAALTAVNAVPAAGDFMIVNPPSLGAAGVDFRGYVTGAGSLSLSSVSIVSCATINIRLLNAASASLASNSGVYRYAAIRTVP